MISKASVYEAEKNYCKKEKVYEKKKMNAKPFKK